MNFDMGIKLLTALQSISTKQLITWVLVSPVIYFSLLVATLVSSNVYIHRTVQVGARLDVAYFRMYVCFIFHFPQTSELIPV